MRPEFGGPERRTEELPGFRGDWNGAMLAMRDYVQRVDGLEPIMHAYRLASFGEWIGGLPRGAADEWAAALLRYDERLPLVARAELAWWRGIHAVARRDGRALSSSRAGARSQQLRRVHDRFHVLFTTHFTPFVLLRP